MTKQEAIKILERDCPKRPQKLWSVKRTEAIHMAIEALKETDMGLNNGDHLHPFGEPFGWTEEEIQKHGLRELLKEADNKNGELSCSEKLNRSDLISRQDSINKFEPWLKVEGYSEGELNMLKAILYELTVMPSTQPEPLTDKEKRIFLAAMGREEKVCKEVDDEWRDCREPYEDSLVRICHEITRKVKGALWT